MHEAGTGPLGPCGLVTAPVPFEQILGFLLKVCLKFINLSPIAREGAFGCPLYHLREFTGMFTGIFKPCKASPVASEESHW